MDLILQIANGIIAISMLVTAFALWKVRKYRILKGGDAVVLLSLLSLFADRTVLAFNLWALSPFVLPIAAGLTITAAAVICSFGPDAKNDSESVCILGKEGRRHCHLAMLAETVGEQELSDAYVFLVDKARAKQAELFIHD